MSNPHPARQSRPLHPCPCKYQKEKAWGYDLYAWNGKKWECKPPTKATGYAIPARAMAMAQALDLDTILICCRGCGAEIYREHPQAAPKPDPETLSFGVEAAKLLAMDLSPTARKLLEGAIQAISEWGLVAPPPAPVQGITEQGAKALLEAMEAPAMVAMPLDLVHRVYHALTDTGDHNILATALLPYATACEHCGEMESHYCPQDTSMGILQDCHLCSECLELLRKHRHRQLQKASKGPTSREWLVINSPEGQTWQCPDCATCSDDGQYMAAHMAKEHHRRPDLIQVPNLPTA